MGTPISGYGPPTTKTRAQVGDFYIDQDSQIVYKCTNVTPGAPLDYGFIDVHQGHDNEYEWESVSDKKVKVTSAYQLFSNGRRMDIFDAFDFSNCTDMTRMFEYNTFKSVPEINTSNVTDMSYMFNSCGSLTSVPAMDTSEVTNMYSMFGNCLSLTSVPVMDTSKVFNTAAMFEYCRSLTSVPVMDTSKVTRMESMFYSCSLLNTVDGIDLQSVASSSSLKSIFYGCASLEYVIIRNIRISLTIGSGTSYGHLLTVDSLVHTIQELCTVTTQQTLTMGSVNLTKIADLYCKITDDTNEKLTMELCDPTDEGAMTLAAYAEEKNWIFK